MAQRATPAENDVRVYCDGAIAIHVYLIISEL